MKRRKFFKILFAGAAAAPLAKIKEKEPEPDLRELEDEIKRLTTELAQKVDEKVEFVLDTAGVVSGHIVVDRPRGLSG